VAIIGISLDDEWQSAQQLIEQHELPWPQVFAPTDPGDRDLWTKATGIAGLPRLFVIDQHGVIRADCRFDELERTVARLIARDSDQSEE
jgi:hypothetical protein